jgi:hypothetical protein
MAFEEAVMRNSLFREGGPYNIRRVGNDQCSSSISVPADADGRGRPRPRPHETTEFGGGFISVELNYKPGSKPPIRYPYEEELRRDVTCSRCALEHAVFGLATWCPNCGADILPTHAALELDVLRTALGGVDQRRERLGARVAARDVENALEDAVSIFEASSDLVRS